MLEIVVLLSSIRIKVQPVVLSEMVFLQSFVAVHGYLSPLWPFFCNLSASDF